MENLDLEHFKKIVEINPFFTKLRKKASIDEFQKSQLKFPCAIKAWQTALISMLNKTHVEKQRNVFIKNLYDEFGNGNCENNHIFTYIKLLNSLNTNNYKYENCEEFGDTHVEKFIKELEDSVRLYSFNQACAMMAMIEWIYVLISKEIHNYLLNFMKEEEIYHYTLHETLDIEHANLLYNLVKDVDYEEVEAGFFKGYEMMFNLYLGMSFSLSNNDF